MGEHKNNKTATAFVDSLERQPYAPVAQSVEQ